MDSDCREACNAIQEVVKGIADGDLPDGVEPLVHMLVELRGAADAIRQAQRFLRNETHVRLADADANRVTLYDGTTVSRRMETTRTGIDREGLVEFVRNHPSAAHVVSETGEVLASPALFVDLLLNCFRQEPRWVKLEQLGLDDEQYCTKQFVPSVVIQPSEMVEADD